MATLTQTRRSPIHPLLVCASMLLCAAGCAPAPEEFFSQTELRAYLAERIPILLSEDEMNRLYVINTVVRHDIGPPVWKDATGKSQDLLSGVILVQGPWRDIAYWDTVEMLFAEAWLKETQGSSRQPSPWVLRALRKIAEDGHYPRTRVAAAAALADSDPALARRILKREYAAFVLVDSSSGQDPLNGLDYSTGPISAGEQLNRLGVEVIPEATSAWGFARLIENYTDLSGDHFEGNNHPYAGAADRYNAKLREYFLAGTQRRQLPERVDVLVLAGECLHAEIQDPTPDDWEDADGGFITAEETDDP